MDGFRLIMLSAMYENGGNVTHRFLDGHPELFVYPFESQLGTRLVTDQLSSVFPVKYRWPVFPVSGTAESDYHSIIDEECKVRARTPNLSKFRSRPFEFSDDDRRQQFVERVNEGGRTQGEIVEAFFRATFEAWQDHVASGREHTYVGYSPILIVDAPRILSDLPDARIIHVVRNPWSAYADTKKRPVPLRLADYLLGWTLNQHLALSYSQMYPDSVQIVRFEDIVADPVECLGAVCEQLGLEAAATLGGPTWNSSPMDEVYPWGTIRVPNPEANRATAAELSDDETEAVRVYAASFIDRLGYGDFL